MSQSLSIVAPRYLVRADWSNSCLSFAALRALSRNQYYTDISWVFVTPGAPGPSDEAAAFELLTTAGLVGDAMPAEPFCHQVVVGGIQHDV